MLCSIYDEWVEVELIIMTSSVVSVKCSRTDKSYFLHTSIISSVGRQIIHSK